MDCKCGGRIKMYGYDKYGYKYRCRFCKEEWRMHYISEIIKPKS